MDRAKVTKYCIYGGTELLIQNKPAVPILKPFKAISTVWPWCLEPGANLWAREKPSSLAAQVNPYAVQVLCVCIVLGPYLGGGGGL